MNARMEQSYAIPLEEAVAEGRRYIGTQAQELGLEVVTLRHPRATSTVDEKVEMLRYSFPGVKLSRQDGVKMLFGRVDWETYAIVMPELGYKIDKNVIEDIFDQAGLEVWDARYVVESDAIPGTLQSLGICTPFLTESELQQLSGVFIHRALQGYESIVDISVGKLHEEDQEAHYKSMLLPGKAIPEILLREYSSSGKIHVVDMPMRRK